MSNKKKVESGYSTMIMSSEWFLQNSLALIESFTSGPVEIQPFVESLVERTHSWISVIPDLKSKHDQVLNEWSTKDTDTMAQRFAFIDDISSLLYFQHEIDNLLVCLSCYLNQKDNPLIKREAEFAGKLLDTYLNRLSLDTSPLVIFTDQFSFHSAIDNWIFTIPYAFYNSYPKWVYLAHEIGHLYKRKNCQISIESLLPTLISSIVKENITEREAEVFTILSFWMSSWLEEIISDYLAVRIAGPAYLQECLVESFKKIMYPLSQTHPPVQIRLACQIKLAHRLGEDVKSLERFMKPDPIKLDPLVKGLTTEKLAPSILDWLGEQKCITKVDSNWERVKKTILEYKQGKHPSEDFDIRFSALSVLSLYSNTQKYFENLRNNT